ncbi:MAG: hypothetical protein ACOCXG_04450 [Nanoarchaeota archaeon]
MKDWEGRHIALKKKLLDYILERAKRKKLQAINKKDLFRIEGLIEDIVDETIELSLDEIKRLEIDEKLTENFSLDSEIERYKQVENNEEIQFMNSKVAHVEFESDEIQRYDVRDEDKHRVKSNWKWDEVVHEHLSPWRMG